MNLAGRKLGLMVASDPAAGNFHHALHLAEEALGRGLEVYLYLIDHAVLGMDKPQLEKLRSRGLKLFACAYSLQKRNLPLEGPATLAGLTILHDLIASTDRFVSFP